jgi:hypothetical protein
VGWRRSTRPATSTAAPGATCRQSPRGRSGRRPRTKAVPRFATWAYRTLDSLLGIIALRPPLAFDQRQLSQVLAIQPQQIEHHEVRPRALERQRIEPRLSVRAEAHDFAIENCIVTAYRACEFSAQVRPVRERVAVAGDELRVMAVDVSQTTKSRRTSARRSARDGQAAGECAAAASARSSEALPYIASVAVLSPRARQCLPPLLNAERSLPRVRAVTALKG